MVTFFSFSLWGGNPHGCRKSGPDDITRFHWEVCPMSYGLKLPSHKLLSTGSESVAFPFFHFPFFVLLKINSQTKTRVKILKIKRTAYTCFSIYFVPPDDGEIILWSFQTVLYTLPCFKVFAIATFWTWNYVCLFFNLGSGGYLKYRVY